jgi:adenosine deaminase
LEGSLEPETIVELARRNGLPSADMSLEEIHAKYGFSDFAGFLEAFKWVVMHLRTPADFALATARLIEQLHRQNVVYAEITVSVGVMLRRKQDPHACFAGVLEGYQHTRKDSPVEVRWIFDAARQFGVEAAMEVARLAPQYRSEGVVAFGLGGDEALWPPALFREVYDYARTQGLRLTAHAGEMAGPESIRDAIELLGVERIGHGIHAVLDPALMERLSLDRITLECCPTSNLATGALARLSRLRRGLRDFEPDTVDLSQHPLREFFDRTLRVTISTDDPALFQTNLLREYSLVGEAMGFTPAELVRIAEMSFESSFLAPAEKSTLLETFRKRARELLSE